MGKYSPCKVDEHGRISINAELRKNLEAEKKAKICLLVNVGDVMVRRVKLKDFELSESNTMVLPAKFRKKFKWAAGHEIAIYHFHSLLVIRPA